MKCKWQPIETAPEDGTRILILLPEKQAVFKCRIIIGNCVRNNWWTEHNRWLSEYDDRYHFDLDPTHWMPLPELPR